MKIDIQEKLDKLRESLSPEDKQEVQVMQRLFESTDNLSQEAGLSAEAWLTFAMGLARKAFFSAQNENPEEYDGTYEEYLIEHALNSLRIMRDLCS